MLISSAAVASRTHRIPSNRLRQVAAELTPLDLAAGNDAALAADALFDRDGKPRASSLFLGLYTRQGAEAALERYGIFEILRDLGYRRPQVAFDTEDPWEHRFTLTDRGDLLADIVLSTRTRRIAGLPQRTGALFVEWIELQHPRAEFGPDHPRLPGQEHPGLGIGREVLELLSVVAARLGLTAVVARPAHFHVAHLYRYLFRCLDGTTEGWLEALMRDLTPFSLAEASWAVHWGCVRIGRSPVRWPAPVMMRPLRPELGVPLYSPRYLLARARAKARYKFVVDRERLKAKLAGQK